MKPGISNQSPKVVLIGSGSVVFAQSLITDILSPGHMRVLNRK